MIAGQRDTCDRTYVAPICADVLGVHHTEAATAAAVSEEHVKVAWTVQVLNLQRFGGLNHAIRAVSYIPLHHA